MGSSIREVARLRGAEEAGAGGGGPPKSMRTASSRWGITGSGGLTGAGRVTLFSVVRPRDVRRGSSRSLE